MNIISNREIPTREGNTLDITLANDNAHRQIIKHRVLHKLNSDHNPTITEIETEQNP